MMGCDPWRCARILLPTLLLVSNVSLGAADNTGDGEDIDSVLQGFGDKPAPHTPADNINRILDNFDDQEGEQGDDGRPRSLQPDTNQRQSDSNATQIPETSNGSSPSLLSSRSFAQISTVYNYAHPAPQDGATDYRGLSRYRVKWQSELTMPVARRWKATASFYVSYDAIYAINGRDQYSRQTLDAFKNEAELLDTFLQGNLTDSIDLRLGRQIIPWGNSENVRVVDVLNPLDLREPGMTKISDLRLPVTAAKIDFYNGHWNLSLIAIPEIRFNKLPPYGSEFYPGAAPPLPEPVVANGGSNTEYGAALKGIFQGWDVSFHWADYFDDQAHHEWINNEWHTAHSRLTMLGVTANGSSGNWLAKSEFARISGLQYAADPQRDYTRLDLLLGTEYSGLRNTVLAVESVIRRIQQFRASLGSGPDQTDRDTLQTVLRYTGNFDHDRITLQAVASFYGKRGADGYLYRLSTDYELRSALVVTFGIVTYHGGDDPLFQFIRHNDRVFADITYHF